MANGTAFSPGGVLRRETHLRLVIQTQAYNEATGADENSEMTGPFWVVNKVWTAPGRTPGYATARVAMAAKAVEVMPSVFNSDAVRKLLPGTPAKVVAEFDNKSYTLMTGRVVVPKEDMADDSADVLIQDARFDLEGMPISGSWRAVGIGGEPKFVHALPCFMNERGKPNCTLVGDRLAFCPPNMGLSDGEDPPQEPTVYKASYWRPCDAFAYFEQCVNRDQPAIAPWLVKLPGNIRIDKGLGAALQDKTYDVSATAHARPMNWEGKTLLDALSELCSFAGPYALGVDYDAEGFGSVLKICDTRFNPDRKYNALVALSGSATSVLNISTATGGSIETSGVGRFTRVAVVGSTHKVERRAGKDGSEYRFVPAWSTEEQTAFLKFLNEPTGGLTDPVQIWRVARQQHPKVGAAYRLQSGWDFQEGSSRDGQPLADIPRVPFPKLWTSYIDTSTTDLMTRLKYPLPVGFEVSTDDGATWYYQDKNDGMEIDPENGIVWLEGLCKETGGRFSTWSGDLKPPALRPGDYITFNKLRATFLIPTDTRLTAAYRRATDKHGTSSDNVDPLDDKSPPASQWAPDFTRCLMVDANGQYEHIDRRDSYPEPEAVAEGSRYGQPITDVPMDDTEAIKSHAKRVFADFTPPATTTQLKYPHIFMGISAGTSIGEVKLAGGGVRVVNGVVTAVTHLSDDASGELTVIDLG